MQNSFSISPQSAIDKLSQSSQEFITLFAHGTLEVEIYKPVGTDKQTPHQKDELYVIISGNGKFYCNGKTVDFNTGDTLFVPAGIEHRFIDFSIDFSTWVFFYGAKGGE
jgi:mannose-6-phosphate isomerase-like protein (cupin superfamily)